MTKACGNIRLVTRTWVLASLICRSVSTRMPYSVGSISICGRGNSRMIRVMGETMQEGGMRGVDADLQRLQPVAVDHALECKCVGVGRGEAVEVRECRRFARAHVGEQDAALLHDRISLLPDTGAHTAAFRLGRSFQALAGSVEQPAVKRAAQATPFQPSICEVRAAVGTGALQEAVAALVVPKQDEIL